MSGFSLCLFLGQGVGVFAISYLVDGPGYGVAFAAVGVGVALIAAWLFTALAARRLTR